MPTPKDPIERKLRRVFNLASSGMAAASSFSVEERNELRAKMRATLPPKPGSKEARLKRREGTMAQMKRMQLAVKKAKAQAAAATSANLVEQKLPRR